VTRRPGDGDRRPRSIRVGLTAPGLPADRYTIGPTDIGGLSIECDACETMVAAWVTGKRPTAVECLAATVAHEAENHDDDLDAEREWTLNTSPVFDDVEYDDPSD
jgi:hypothetical protein